MKRFIFLVMLMFPLVASGSPAAAQIEPSYGARSLTPFKSARQKALLATEGRRPLVSNLAGKLRPKTAENQANRLKELQQDKALTAKEKEVLGKQLALEEKKLAAEEKALKEANKPWEVASPENLESPSPLLQMAAKSKQDQDLAPKKIDALNYLASLGCVLDPSVQDALMAGLKDANEEVRAAAVQAVISSYRGVVTPYPGGMPPQPYPWEEGGLDDPNEKPAADPNAMAGQPGAAAPAPYPYCSTCPNPNLQDQQTPGGCSKCKGHRFFQKFAKRNCDQCAGGGCPACNYGGCVTEVYTEPCSCCEACELTCENGSCSNSCKRCCTPEILAQLKKMAEEPNPEKKDCYYEPSDKVRNMALEALSLCPGTPEKKTDPEPERKPNLDETGGADLDEKPNLDEGVDLEPDDETNSDEETNNNEDGNSPEENMTKDDLTGLSSSLKKAGKSSGFQSVSFRSNRSRMLPARVTDSYNQNEFLVQIPDDYLIPQDKLVYLKTVNGDSQTATITNTKYGLIAIELPFAAAPIFQLGEELQLGIIND